MNNIYYIYFLFFKIINIFLITLIIFLTSENKVIMVLAMIVSFYYLLSKQNTENRFIKRELYLKPIFLTKRVFEIIVFFGLVYLNLLDILLIFCLLDYILKLTIDESLFEIYYNTKIKIRRKDESTT